MTTNPDALDLQVTAAFPRDQGRGLARLGPASFRLLKLEDGDTVEVVGRRITACLVQENAGEPGIQLDEITRRNAGLDVAATARVRRCDPSTAEAVTLVDAGNQFGGVDELDELRRALGKRPLRVGDRLHLPRPGGFLELAVEETVPAGTVRLDDATQLMIQRGKSTRADGAPTTFDDIGGLGQQLLRVREIIELPLRFPEIFERLGIDAPRGVLLHGPPGCGKTLTARAAAHEIEAAFFSVSGPEIVHKFYGESEAHLRNLFEQAAEQSPAIVFLDEIDAIAPSRDKVRGEVEKRVVAQLLALMDGLARRPRVIVIAATNRPNALDSALRRPGRFDREIMIPVPDPSGRREILAVHTRRMPLGDGVDLDQLAAATHGFVGADLEALCREAAMSRVRTLLPELDLQEKLDPEVLGGLEVTADDFATALYEVQPSALREVSIEVPNVGWDAVGGLEDVKARLRAVFEWPLRHPELFERANVRPTKGILLQGPTGCGKTLLARAMASESGVNFIAVQGPELLSQYVGESEEKLRDTFRKARRASPCILFFDEIDALFPVRSDGGQDSRTSERILSQFLAELDGIEELRDVLVLGATNRPDLLDPALLRPDRFDEILRVDLPDALARRQIFAVHLEKKPLAEEPDLDDLAARTEGFSGAEIAEAVRRSALTAIARVLDEATNEEASPDAVALRPSDIEAALTALRPETA